MPAFLLLIPAYVRAVPSWAWKWLAVGVILIAVFFYGYNKGKSVERARCEAQAQRAQQAANAQDFEAQREGRAQDLEITNALTQQKKVDDETIEALKKQLAARKAGDPCVYDKSTADPDDPPSRVRNK